MEIDIDELVDDIAKQADLDSYESDMLLHDINNLRGDEWIEIIEEYCEEETKNQFFELIMEGK